MIGPIMQNTRFIMSLLQIYREMVPFMPFLSDRVTVADHDVNQHGDIPNLLSFNSMHEF